MYFHEARSILKEFFFFFFSPISKFSKILGFLLFELLGHSLGRHQYSRVRVGQLGKEEEERVRRLQEGKERVGLLPCEKAGQKGLACFAGSVIIERILLC